MVATVPESTVHPRGRGEHFIRLRTQWRHGGSSPRTRGTPLVGYPESDENRFIPADAGNTKFLRKAS